MNTDTIGLRLCQTCVVCKREKGFFDKDKEVYICPNCWVDTTNYDEESEIQ
jgi:hypothetical protein